MITKDQIAQACSDADALADEHEEIVNYWRKRGVDLDGLTYVAMQRGLRAVLLNKGIDPNRSRPYGVHLNTKEQALQMMFAAIFMDGFAARDRIEED